ncbi:hypothetical protein J31TS4_15640 [Paenibacillus sp. J31TS4]|uniref:DUF1697 domain-containing protein n=1 Tax=Paenibacillus sp. J31TS4 TaxID=2807195 RepID=UPI001B236DAC|nr:DUF1697 domain-containing protein [Paenibacillus sp. J31TS4]GIP38284.1 hypothetical protein J31TS4_15640 [Paenibacillus sp. J31TS4]
MTSYIALLRGINVGGKNKIKMAELKAVLEAAGFRNVQTYIQSGNVLLDSELSEREAAKRMEAEIEKAFGIALTVVLRTFEELRHAAANCPFTEAEIAEAEAQADGERLYAAFLPEEPGSEGIARLNACESGKDEFRIVGKDVYLLFRQSIRDSKLSANLAKLGVPVTVRNWRTVSKLVALADERTVADNG